MIRPLAWFFRLLPHRERRYRDEHYRKFLKDLVGQDDSARSDAIMHLVAIAKQGRHRIAVVNRLTNTLALSPYGASKSRAAWGLGELMVKDAVALDLLRAQMDTFPDASVKYYCEKAIAKINAG